MGKKIECECPICGTTYLTDSYRLAKYGRGTTCSKTCSYILRGQKKQRAVMIQCATCGVEFTRPPAQIKSKHGAMYCSRTCHYQGRTLGLTKRIVAKPYVRVADVDWKAVAAKTRATRIARNNYRHTPESRRKLSEATTRAMAEGRIAVVSNLENKVAAEFDRLGITYRRQVGIRGAKGRWITTIDFMLDDGRAVEVNGTYWHADPRVYPDGPIYPSQRRSVDRWPIKIAALENAGIPLIVLWELDLSESFAETIRVALES